MDRTIGFIILRHVSNRRTNQYWNLCYDSIRRFYPEHHILIIDDNSNKEYLNNRVLYHTTIIQSEYPGRGEILPYYYYLTNKLFDIAVIIHDSVFINQYIDFHVETYHMIWDFDYQHWPEVANEDQFLALFNDHDLSYFYNQHHEWRCCFGAMCIITHDYLTMINSKNKISVLLDVIVNRYTRSIFERIIGALLQIHSKQPTLFGRIGEYIEWGLPWERKDSFAHLPIIKVWSGR